MYFIEFIVNNYEFITRYLTRILFLLFTAHLSSYNCNEIGEKFGYKKKKKKLSKIMAYIVHFLIALLPFISWSLTLLFLFTIANKEKCYTEEYFEKSKEYNK